jgi:hypothetical protein
MYNGKLMFKIGVQSFTLDYTPEDEPEMSAGQQAEWMRSMLEKALNTLAASKPDWTPVTQALPACEGQGWSENVLVEYDNGAIRVDAHFCSDPSLPQNGWFEGERAPGVKAKVVAWQPLPAPSKASSALPQETPFLEGLSQAQKDFIIGLPIYVQAETASYLLRGVDCGVGLQKEMDDAPPFALYVKECPEFWIDCFDLVTEAKSAALRLGLRVVD